MAGRESAPATAQWRPLASWAVMPSPARQACKDAAGLATNLKRVHSSSIQPAPYRSLLSLTLPTPWIQQKHWTHTDQQKRLHQGTSWATHQGRAGGGDGPVVHFSAGGAPPPPAAVVGDAARAYAQQRGAVPPPLRRLPLPATPAGPSAGRETATNCPCHRDSSLTGFGPSDYTPWCIRQ